MEKQLISRFRVAVTHRKYRASKIKPSGGARPTPQRLTRALPDLQLVGRVPPAVLVFVSAIPQGCNHAQISREQNKTVGRCPTYASTSHAGVALPDAPDLFLIRRLGVVGEQPILAPNESFKYSSWCPLRTPTGLMRGTYQMLRTGGEQFDVEIAPFALKAHRTVH